MLVALKEKSQLIPVLDYMAHVFTWSGIGQPSLGEPLEWISEDYRLCMRLGGVHLLPIALGHVKKRVLYPSEQNISDFFGV